MRPLRRPIVVLTALTLTVAACSASGDATTTTTPPPTTTAPTTTNTTSPPATAAPGGDPATTTTVSTTTTAAPDDNVVTIAVDVEGATITGGGRQTVREGSIVRLLVTADREDEVHVHGYDLWAAVAPDTAAVFDFAAGATGVFTVELENSGLELLQLEIVP